MKNPEKIIQSSASGTQEYCCKECGGTFVFRKCERERFGNYGWTAPKRCPDCRKAAQERKREAEKQRKNAEWQEKKVEEKKSFESCLKEWNVVGNSFDAYHVHGDLSALEKLFAEYINEHLDQYLAMLQD